MREFCEHLEGKTSGLAGWRQKRECGGEHLRGHGRSVGCDWAFVHRGVGRVGGVAGEDLRWLSIIVWRWCREAKVEAIAVQGTGTSKYLAPGLCHSCVLELKLTSGPSA